MDPHIRASFDSMFIEFQQWASVAFDPSKVTTEEQGNFCHITVALCLAAERNYEELRDAYDRQDQTQAAWACRNLMEIAIYMKFVLQSCEDAEEFAADRLIDARDIATAFKKIMAELSPDQPDPDLDATLWMIQKQMASEGVTRTEYLRVSDLAKRVKLRAEYDNMNRVCSKFVHPSAWSLFTGDQGLARFPSAGEIFYVYGVKYFAMVYAEIRPHVRKYGLHHRPKP